MPDFAPMPFELETERLILRLWDEADAEGYRRLVGERGDPVPTIEDARAEIREARASAPGRGIHLLTLRTRDGGGFLGYCGLVIGRSTIEEPEIAYELLREAHGNGYAAEAAQAVVAAARATGRRRIRATVATWNTASFRVLDKLGFRREHADRDERSEFVWNSLGL